ncbi:arsenic resistance protein [Leisingera sp. F5]|jgi:ACR3 family arsenite efflux pump ArsB|uniref:arsenic resistance protein n=1 Tax=Leisingera sp. F5 TaxID=1813816 RepID=UPI000A5E29EF|nr:arsenic resistance protein [Leisingera sp. F5]
MRDRLERRQITVYLGAIGLGIAVGSTAPDAAGPLEFAVTPVLAALIYTTFLQVPLADLRGAMRNRRFLGALLVANFIAVPLLVWLLFQMVPSRPAVQLGVLLVLLTPCIDYVVVFTHMGRGNARLVLAATPLLLVVQFLLLPFYLWLFLGPGIADLLRPGPFLAAFLWLIATPLILAWLTEFWAGRHASGERFTAAMAWAPVPLMALTLFLVIAAELPRIETALADVLGVVPVYFAYVLAAPIIGWAINRLARLEYGASRALIFSISTRNSLVVLPLALAAPFDGGIAAAIVVTQTCVELLAELAYIRLVPALVTARSTHQW